MKSKSLSLFIGEYLIGAEYWKETGPKLFLKLNIGPFSVFALFVIFLVLAMLADYAMPPYFYFINNNLHMNIKLQLYI